MRRQAPLHGGEQRTNVGDVGDVALPESVRGIDKFLACAVRGLFQLQFVPGHGVVGVHAHVSRVSLFERAENERNFGDARVFSFCCFVFWGMDGGVGLVRLSCLFLSAMSLFRGTRLFTSPCACVRWVVYCTSRCCLSSGL